jgi:hypothetical protein
MVDRESPLPPRIEVGRAYIWEPSDPKARVRIHVTKIIVKENGEAWVDSVAENGCNYWNEADRFQEACIYA